MDPRKNSWFYQANGESNKTKRARVYWNQMLTIHAALYLPRRPMETWRPRWCVSSDGETSRGTSTHWRTATQVSGACLNPSLNSLSLFDSYLSLKGTNHAACTTFYGL